MAYYVSSMMFNLHSIPPFTRILTNTIWYRCSLTSNLSRLNSLSSEENRPTRKLGNFPVGPCSLCTFWLYACRIAAILPWRVDEAGLRSMWLLPGGPSVVQPTVAIPVAIKSSSIRIVYRFHGGIKNSLFAILLHTWKLSVFGHYRL